MVDGSKILRRLFTIAIIFLMVLPNFIVPVSAATEARMIYSYNFDGVQINTVDTNMAGTKTCAGLNNGSIICMDNAGIIIYNIKAGYLGAVKKISMDDNGNLAFVTKAAEGGWITSSGYMSYYNAPASSLFNASDVSIDKTANNFIVNWNLTAYSLLYGISSAGAVLYSNQTPSSTNIFTVLDYDSVNGLIVLANSSATGMPSNKIYLYNVSNYTGWLIFNPLKTIKNSTHIILDQFPYRQNISTNNGNTVSVNFTFIDNLSQNDITRFINGSYSFNASKHGKYFLWTYGNGMWLNQSMINISKWNSTLKQYIVNIKPTSSPASNNLTFYYGKTDYTNEIVTGMYNITQNISITTNASGWTAPSNAHYVFKVNVTGGGGGGATPTDSMSDCYEFSTCIWGGPGGTSTATSGSYGFINPSTYFGFSIGDGGAGAPGGCIPGPDAGDPGSTSTAFGFSSSGGSGGSGGCGSQALAAGTSHAYYLNEMKGGWGNPAPGYSGGAGGSGYGSGGGGGEPDEGYYCDDGPGGKGASGAVNFTYWTWNPQYFKGAAGTSPYLGPVQYEDISTSMNFVQSLDITGNATAVSIPEGGGIAGVSTAGVSSGVAGKLYHIIITPTGFGSSYSGTSDIGIPVQVATSDSGTYSIEARGSWIDIYQLDGVLKGQYNTGGLVNSVDISDRNGLWAVAGGTDGIFYVFDKASTSGWEVYYQGDSESAINSVAVTEGGEYAAAGRVDGTFEYYDLKTSIAAAEAIFSVDLFVTKGGTPYPNVNISIVELTNAIPSLVTGNNITTKTDTNGHYVFTVTEKNYYNISVNDGEYYQLYQASPIYKVIAVNLPYPLMVRAFNYGATYDDNTHTITSTYSDVNTADVNLSIIDVTSKSTIYSVGYIGTKSFTNNFVVPDANKSYKVLFNFTRTTGAKYSDTIYLQSSIFSAIPKNTSDQYTLFIYAIYTLILMVVSLSIGTQSLKYGAVMLVALTFLGIILGFLPLSLYTGGIATIAFIALLEVYRRRE